ncbi:glycoside hydrolase family 3 N-terminal domain-containing protein [Bradyrhizobium archetypum]|nr:glycoside hydrolase family 3 N-terminal domain-containing protein [Bradyrhizobium archetypum]
MVMVMAPEMAVAMAMPEAMAMPMTVTVAMAVTTAGESRGWDRQRCRGKRESADGGRDDLLDANHGVLLTCSAGIALRCCNLKAPILVRCDQHHPAGMVGHRVTSDDLPNLNRVPKASTMRIGELFILGFFGNTVPDWLKEFAARYGLGGVILFDYSCRTQAYDNNIESPEQVQRLCAEISALPSGPMVFIDQEGGLVRRLKESRGFAPLPSAKEFNHLAPDEKRAILAASFAEMRRLGIHYDFAPVIDVDYNPDNPNIGRIKRSYSADIAEVKGNALLASEVARAQRIGLCLKHFPGIGGAVVDSHHEFMDISDALRAEQEELFYSLAPKMFGNAVLVSHAIVRQWDQEHPMTLSATGLGRLRGRLPDTLLITDDMQMQGLQKALGTRQASLQSLKAGMDMLCIGNNLFDQEQEMIGTAEYIRQSLRDGILSSSAIEQSSARIVQRKALLTA